ncbi:uncharacterized protein Dwil_GK10371 [Drosophila willistoni]|uniref:Tryptophan--tRNA ligase, mitochondrial n=1 Tax=Drosophila willistoni TaxID=7260 RepID=B4N4T4_DROWI|nr:uncharacterized protein LOC6645679 [Drosophila willistoni]EDW79158.1 uncharacterized protein Dwil_GK10371 [Drosophila willistoni]
MFRAGKLNKPVVLAVQRMQLARRSFHVDLLHQMPASSRGSGSSYGGYKKGGGGSTSATAQVLARQSVGSVGGRHPPFQSQSHKYQQEQQQPTVPKQEQSRWPRRIFSGIQPTGALHLGNYLGAVRKWTQLQKARDDVTVCIVDMHSITMPHNPPVLRENIFTLAATLLACGIDPCRSTLFVQSAVLEHSELNWILSSLTTLPRLAQLPQFKEKSRMLKDVPLGLYVYPVLQAADIMLYKATHVPVGADQLQHIQLAQHLARSFNTRYGDTFPVCHALIEESEASRVLSLRDPTKKMSKSEENPKATINIIDSPEQITEKIRKAITDFTSDISYNPSTRPGVSNLVSIHAQVTGQSISSVVEEANTLDTGKYKDRVAEAIIEHLRPIREQIQQHLAKRNELIYMLEIGAEKARQTAQQTMSDVKQRLGLGTNAHLPPAVQVAPLLPGRMRMTASQRMSKGVLMPNVNAHAQPHYDQRHEPGHGASGGSAGEAATGELKDGMSFNQYAMRPLMRRPVVPTQHLRVEKLKNKTPPRHIFIMDKQNAPSMGFRSPSSVNVTGGLQRRQEVPPAPKEMGFTADPTDGNFGQNTNPSALASITRAANAATKQQEFTSTLANSAYYKASITPSALNLMKTKPYKESAASKCFSPSLASSSSLSSFTSASSSPSTAPGETEEQVNSSSSYGFSEEHDDDDENSERPAHEVSKAEV